MITGAGDLVDTAEVRYARSNPSWRGPLAVAMASCAAIWIAIVAVSPSPEVVALGAGGGVITATLFLLIQGQQLRLRGLAETDPLTRLTNHGSFHEALARELARAERGGTPLSLVVFDLDDFKRLNDTHGHPYGDAVLRQAGERLRASIRSSDTAGRVGGEEFAVLLPGTGDALAFEVAERIRTAIAQVEVDDGRLSCSAGVAVYPDDAGDPEALFERGDAALYAAKRTGKARTYRWTSEMTPEKTRRRGERRRAGGRDGDNPSEG